MMTWTNRLVLRLIPFDEDDAHREAHELVSSIEDPLVPAALQVATARAVSQDATVGNIRSRATGVLSVAGLVVTFVASIGLLANDPSHGGHRFHDWAAWTLVGVLIVLAS